jgi:hypothetical protein
MTIDLVFELAPRDENVLRLTLRAPNGDHGLTADRPFPAVDPAKLDELRLGNPASPVVDEVATAVSDWLLEPTVRQRLAEALVGQEHIRLVVNVDRPLRPRLSDLPLELVSLPNTVVPLVLHPRVDTLVHLLPVAGEPPPAPRRDWPLKILLVRSNPPDLGGFVPEGGPIRAAILEAATGLPAGSVVVRLLSSEQDPDKPVTWRACVAALEEEAWDVLVYLGHGDVREGVDPVSVLQFESADANASDPIDTRKITWALLNHPVPVVILAGCLTAAELAQADPGMRERIRAALPKWLRGASGVAQALIDSEAGVELAVGMRYRLEVDQAREFLAGFFASLLETAPGNTELAVRAGRNNLFNVAPIPPSWSAPVVFARRTAPRFEFLVDPRTASLPKEQKDKLDGFVQMRQLAAKNFVQTLGDRSTWLDFLASIAADEAANLGTDAMIRPRFVQTAPGNVTIGVELVGSLNLRRLAGEVSITGGVEIDRLRRDSRLGAAGFGFLKDEEEGGRARFVIEREGGAGRGSLDAGPLFTIEAGVTTKGPFVHEVRIVTTGTDSKRRVWPGTDLIAVLPE